MNTETNQTAARFALAIDTILSLPRGSRQSALAPIHAEMLAVLPATSPLWDTLNDAYDAI